MRRTLSRFIVGFILALVYFCVIFVGGKLLHEGHPVPVVIVVSVLTGIGYAWLEHLEDRTWLAFTGKKREDRDG